jgi:hypothetical protein
MKVEFSRHFFEKFSNIRFHENPSSGGRVVSCGQADRHGEADSRISKFFERASNLLCFGACLCLCVQVKHKNKNYFVMISSDSSVDYALRYGIYDRGIRVRVPVGFYIFPAVSKPVPTSLIPSVHREIIWTGCEPDHSYQSWNEVKNVWNYTFTPPYFFMSLYYMICCCEVLARQRYNVFGKLIAEPKDISTASVRDLCLFIRGTGLLNLCWMECLGLHNKPTA